ncbi:Kinesin-like protein [Parasponia andersonii]|uniref:Kinesin-like protein n=1 Tax=Parasponia andersonii TaxID=3476 RepID=A0A2P5CWX5_PARAD|nr:Kinesin-like protein [Parasponia andersonii]
MEKICVAVRVRPAVSEESSAGTYWNVDDNRISLHKAHGTPLSGISYAFDHLFDESCSNSMVYDVLTKDIIRAALEGFNGTAFAYGQTSSGKTFTMNGSEKDPGIIHRAVEDIFERIQMISDREFLIRVSYMEIYNEEINDLFAVENQKLPIHESLERGVFVAGLKEEIVNNAEQVMKLLESGEANRHFGETNMNVRSSRSHTIFRMVIESKGKDTNFSSDYLSSDAIRVSVLNLVDLAGSERIAKTGAGGVRLKEGKHINKSLMVLGNVINKLSDGAKNRGHIPYRDSKLTRILQPALGGNAKTSIVCTIAPEEVHVEETKGTLQFASRAKRIANCVQVNEILTDAALLKRQKLEIEELRMKLQGSHAEVLEQEILKLRNDLLKYELEHEKLEMQLEEERKSHKERDCCIREQQMKIDNLSNLVTFSDTDRNSSQGQVSGRGNDKEECNNSNSISQGDAFSTPCFKAVPSAFVARRSNYSVLPDYSPLPDTISHVADEDTWLKMNRGYIADLDSLQMTPERKVQSFPSTEVTPDCPNENYKQGVENLKRQLELVIQERDVLKRKHTEDVVLNNQLMVELSELRQEAQLIQEIPQRLCKCAANCKDVYVDALSMTQSFISDGKSSTAKLVSSMSEIGASLFTILETHFSMALDGNHPLENDNLIQEQHKVLSDRLKSTIKSLLASETLSSQDENEKNPLCRCEHKGSTLKGETTCWKEKLSNELNTLKERYHGLEKELGLNNQLLEESKQRYNNLETEFHHLLEEREALCKMVSESSRKLAIVTNQKDNVLKDLNAEFQRRKDLQEKIKQFSVAFAHRKTSLVSFHSEFKYKIEEMRAQNPVSTPKSLGC